MIRHHMLSQAQRFALMKLSTAESERCGYHDLCGGCTARTLAWLVLRGLAEVHGKSPKEWSITDAGRQALERGSFEFEVEE